MVTPARSAASSVHTGSPADAGTVNPADDPTAAALARMALGERAALQLLYRQCSAHLFGVILRIQADRGVAEDLLQDVFITIWRSAATFDASRGQALAWLTSVARHRAIDSLRRRKTEVQTVSSHVTDDDGTEHDRTAQAASDAPSPLDLLLQAAQARQVSHCMGELTAEQRQCLALAYYQGQSHAELAEHLAQPLGTVKSWIRRALLALKDCLTRATPAVRGES